MPCPMEIDMPRIFELFNDAVMFNDAESARELYIFEQHSVEVCNECGICVKRCGRGIAIPELIREAHKLLGD
jgi:hypothetical protein